MRLTLSAGCAIAVAIISLCAPALAVDGLNIYSARHYDSDELLYNGFQDATGIPLKFDEGGGPGFARGKEGGGKNPPRRCLLDRRCRKSMARGKREALPAGAVESPRWAHSRLAQEPEEFVVRV